MHVKRQQVEHEKVHRQIAAAVSVVVFDMIALVFQRVEGLVLDFPARSSTFDQLYHVVFIYCDIRNPAITISDFVFGDQFVLEKIDIVGIRSAVERHPVDPSVQMPPTSFVGVLKAPTLTQCVKLVDPLEQYFVIVGFGHQDVGHTRIF